MSEKTKSGWSHVYRAVRKIPMGRVSTYGEIAARSGMPRAARQVGWALNALEDGDDVPWHRVINAHGQVSERGERVFGDLHSALLEAEGIEIGVHGRIDLDRYGWPTRTKKKSASKKTAKKKGLKKKASKKAAKKKAARKKTVKSRASAPAKKRIVRKKTGAR